MLIPNEKQKKKSTTVMKDYSIRRRNVVFKHKFVTGSQIDKVSEEYPLAQKCNYQYNGMLRMDQPSP